MDQFLSRLTGAGGSSLGTNILEKGTSLPYSNDWRFSREHLHEPKEKIGITINDEMRIVAVAPNSHASAVSLLPNRYFIASVNGERVRSEAGFWTAALSSLDVHVVLCECGPMDELLHRISSNADFSSDDANNNNNNNDDDAEFAVDFSPPSPRTSGAFDASSNGNQNGEPNYAALLQRDEKRYAFLTLSHPLHYVWQTLRSKAVKARDVLRRLEEQLREEERAKAAQLEEDALKLLDDSDDDDDDDDKGTHHTTSIAGLTTSATSATTTTDQQQNSRNVLASLNQTTDVAAIFDADGKLRLNTSAATHNKNSRTAPNGEEAGADDDDANDSAERRCGPPPAEMPPDVIKLVGGTKPAAPSCPPPWMLQHYRADQKRRDRQSSSSSSHRRKS